MKYESKLKTLGRPDTIATSHKRDDGDTLIEILVAIAIFGIVSLSVFVGFGTLISGSSTYRNLAVMNSALMSASTNATSELQVDSPSLFKTCATVADYQPGGSNAITFPGLPSGYTAEVTGVSFWNASSFSGNCSSTSQYPATATGAYPNYAYSCPNGGTLGGTTCTKTVYAESEKITIKATNSAKGVSDTNSFVVINPQAFPSMGNHLAIVQQPALTTSCPPGYTYSGGYCTETLTTPAIPS